MQNRKLKAANKPIGIRSEVEVTNFFNQQLVENQFEMERNWYWPFILEDVNRYSYSQYGIIFPPEPTEYSNFLIESGRSVIEEIYPDESADLSGLRIALIQSSAAYGSALPFYASLDKENLPEHTQNLAGNVYTWLFTSLGKSNQYSNIRLLDNGYGSELKMCLVTRDEHEMDHNNIRSSLSGAFISRFNFSPPLSVEMVKLRELGFFELISGQCIFGDEFQYQFLSDCFVEIKGNQFFSRYVGLIDKIAREFYRSKELSALQDDFERSNSVFRVYQQVRTNEDPMIIIDHPAIPNVEQNTWKGRNSKFFQKLKENDFDLLVVEDATKQLDDKKGQDKTNQYTVCRVIGLRKGQELIPAERIILKLRGLSWYRNDLNNLIDLIKEYSSYTYIHQTVSNPTQFFLGCGPLILSCEKLELPFEKSEIKRWIGIFLEEVTPLDGQIVYTCRVRRISDFWSLESSHKRVIKDAGEHGIELNDQQLTHQLITLSQWLWLKNLSIDYCDLMFLLDKNGNISEMKIIDLERLSYGELVNEKHIFLEAFVDIKSYLLPDHWFYVLENIYHSETAAGDYIPLNEVKNYQRKPSRRRVLMISACHYLEGISRSIGQTLGMEIWSIFIRFLVSVFTLRYRSARFSN